jgi:hypothetical protein
MNPVSAEQALIIHNIKTVGANVIVDAVAGSGKSTTILSLARAPPEGGRKQSGLQTMWVIKTKQFSSAILIADKKHFV